MTYNSVIDDFIKKLKSTHDEYTVISEQETSLQLVYIENASEGGGSYQYVRTYSNNLAYSYLLKICSNLEHLKSVIHSSLKCLFDDPEDVNGTPDTNHILLNAYGNSSKAYEKFLEDTEEFTKLTEYWYTRGHFTDLLVEADKGKTYLYDPCNDKIDDVYNKICKKYQVIYNNGRYEDLYITVTSGESTEDQLYKTAVQVFWDEYFEDFKKEVDEKLVQIHNVVNNFGSLKTYILNFKGVFETYSRLLSKGSEFIGYINKTSTGEGTELIKTYDTLGVEGITKYSTEIGSSYALFDSARTRRNNSKYVNDDENNYYLQKIMISMILSQQLIHLDENDNIPWEYIKTSYDIKRIMKNTGKTINYFDYAPKMLKKIKNFRINVLKEKLS